MFSVIIILLDVNGRADIGADPGNLSDFNIDAQNANFLFNFFEYFA